MNAITDQTMGRMIAKEYGILTSLGVSEDQAIHFSEFIIGNLIGGTSVEWVADKLKEKVKLL